MLLVYARSDMRPLTAFVPTLACHSRFVVSAIAGPTFKLRTSTTARMTGHIRRISDPLRYRDAQSVASLRLSDRTSGG